MYLLTLGVCCCLVWLAGSLVDPSFLSPESFMEGLTIHTLPGVLQVGAVGVVLNHRFHCWLVRKRGKAVSDRRMADFLELQLVLGLLAAGAGVFQIAHGMNVAWGLISAGFGAFAAAGSALSWRRGNGGRELQEGLSRRVMKRAPPFLLLAAILLALWLAVAYHGR